MLLDLSRVRTARERCEERYQPDAFAPEGEIFRVVAPAALDFDIFKDKQQFRLIGTVKTTLELECGRCLEAFELPVDAPFDLRYQPQVENRAEGKEADVEVDEDDLTTAFYEHDQIDLGQLMREQFLLAIPMKPLCGADCRGLCPVCGTNFNRDMCACKREWDDPRLAVLRALKTEN